MPSPFPGMDPYLETPHLWPDVHHELISQLRGALNAVIRPRYVARVELRVYISDEDDPGREVLVPDVRIEQPRRGASKKTKESSLVVTEPIIVPLLIDDEIKEAHLEIRHVESNTLVSVIEILSPATKVRGSRGRASFLEKRQNVLISEANSIEIDLLRAGLPSINRPRLASSDYRILVSRAVQHSQARYWPVNIRQPLPVIGIPLRGDDPDVPISLGEILTAAYDRGAYELSIDYRRPPDPPLKAADAAWAKGLLREHGLP